MRSINEIERDLKEATEEYKILKKMGRAKSFKTLSSYSKNLHEERELKAMGRQMDLLEELTNMVAGGHISQKDSIRIIKNAGKKHFA